jgi:mRNA-degrading endonuclease RelE of RelBE toxin-antitoxin system
LSRANRRVVVNGPAELQAYLDSPGEEEVKKQIREMLHVLRANPAAGEHVRKRLWPDQYAKQRVNNLFRYRIGDQVRFAYTIIDDPSTRTVKILSFFRTHKEYERVFGYD